MALGDTMVEVIMKNISNKKMISVMDAMLNAGLIKPVSVMKVAHHGSSRATSDAFLQAAKPEFAAISVGAMNDYGHPAAKLLDRLAAHGCTVYRTDLDGTVCFAADSDTIRVQTQISF